MDRLDELERLAARIELEIRAERARRGRKRLRKGPPGHGTERDYQREAKAHREGRRDAEPCDVCKAAHALHQKRRDRARKGMT